MLLLPRNLIPSSGSLGFRACINRAFQRHPDTVSDVGVSLSWIDEGRHGLPEGDPAMHRRWDAHVARTASSKV